MKYLLFEYDQGGPNNIITAFKYIIFLAKITNRIIVLPKPKPIYHFDWGPAGIIEDPSQLNEDTIIEETCITDMIDLNPFEKFVKIISFAEFVEQRSEIPNCVIKYDNKLSERIQIKPQVSRFSKTKGDHRPYYWNAYDNYLENLIRKNKIKKDWILYCRENFRIIHERNAQKFVDKLLQKTGPKYSFIHIPMDENYKIKKKERYPRMFDFTKNFKFEDKNQKIWSLIHRKLKYHPDFYTVVENIIFNKMNGDNYDALHWRYSGFHQKKEKTGIQILEEIKSKVKSKVLYISSDSTNEIFSDIDQTKFHFKIISSKDFEISTYLKNPKFLSFIELLLCVKSYVFIGTHRSTFSCEILNTRKKTHYTYKNMKGFITKDNKNYLI